MLALPLGVVLLSTLGVLPLNGRSGDVILSISMFGGCWMLGFAHHDHRIRALPLARVLVGGASLMALGLAWAFTHPDPVTAYDLNNIPLADTLYGLGAVLILLRLNFDLSWLDRRIFLDKLVTVISSRAMTIYLWGSFAIFLANPLLDLWSVTADLNHESALGYVWVFLASWLILTIFIFTFGWCEDLAARRQMRINPWPRDKQQLETMRTRRVLAITRPAWLSELTPGRLFIGTACLLAAASVVSAAALFGTDTPGRANTVAARSHNALNQHPDAGTQAVVQNAPAELTQPPKLLPPAVVAASSTKQAKATALVPRAGVATVRAAAPTARKTAKTTRKTIKATRKTVKATRKTAPAARHTSGRDRRKSVQRRDDRERERTGLHPRRTPKTREHREHRSSRD